MPRVIDRIADDSGVVAVETFLSVMLIVIITILFWGGATLLHNQATIQGATQLAADESLVAYDRTGYRNLVGNTSLLSAAAQSIYSESALGLINDPFAPAATASSAQVTLQCAPTYPADGGTFATGNCGAARDQGRVERVSISGSAQVGTLLLDPFGGVTKSSPTFTLRGTGTAYSAGPCSNADQNIFQLATCN